MFGTFPGYTFGSHFIWAPHTHTRWYTTLHTQWHSQGSAHPMVSSSSSHRCHSVTSSAGLAVSQRCPPLEPEISFNRAHPVMLLCHSGAQTGSTATMTAQRMRAQEQVQTIDRTLGCNYEKKPKGLLKRTYILFKSIKNTSQSLVKG